MGAIGSVVGPLIGASFYNTHPEYLFIVQSVTLTIYAVVVWTQLPETVPPISKSKQTVEASSPKAICFLNITPYSVLWFLHFLLAFFYAQTETNYRIFCRTCIS